MTSQDNNKFIFEVGDLVKASLESLATYPVYEKELGIILKRKAYGPYGAKSYLVKWFPIEQPRWCVEQWIRLVASTEGSSGT